jgi:cytoskeletal protein CcmA (bactofilin family)
MAMAREGLGLWRSLARHLGVNRGIEVVFDRRQGERRRRIQSVDRERRREERRRPLNMDLSEVCGFLGEGTRWRGELRFTGAVRVDGHLEGEVVRGEALIIGERGHVRAAIEVEILQVRGHVQGDITVRKRAELLRTSRVTGTIQAPCVVIWRGAVFNGRCETPRP